MRPGELDVLAHGVRVGRISARALVDEALRRIQAHGDLNAVVALRAEEARREAADLDRSAPGERTGDLAGIPFLVKDIEDVAGMRTTHGSLLFADSEPATHDSLIPGRLRAAGAIVVGKSNVPEFATEGYTDNLVFGSTHNPWNPAWSPGGSSGGSAAAMAAGLVPLATATDGGGSIRIPAALCGLVGIKPTNGTIGRYPPEDWIDLSTPGPMGTTVADLRLLLALERGPVPGDPTALPYAALGTPAGPSTRLYAAHRTSPLGPLPASLAATFDAAVAELAAVLGLPVVPLEPGAPFPAGDPDLDWFVLATAEHVASLGRDRVVDGLEQMHPAARAFMRQGLEVGIDEYLAARRRRFEHVRTLDLLLGEADLLVTPTVALEGWAPDGSLPDGVAVDGAERGPAGMLPPAAYSTALQNVTGHPAVTLPAGSSANGLPFGLQVTGPRYAEEALLDVAERWESAHPWPRVSPGHTPFADAFVEPPGH